MILLFIRALPQYIEEVAIALAPIIVFFFLFNAIYIKLSKNGSL